MSVDEGDYGDYGDSSGCCKENKRRLNRIETFHFLVYIVLGLFVCLV